MIKWLVKNDGSDELFNIHVVTGNSQKELLYDMLVLFGSYTEYSVSDLAADILSKSIKDVSDWSDERIDDALDRQVHKHEIAVPEDDFLIIEAFLDEQLLNDLRSLLQEE